MEFRMDNESRPMEIAVTLAENGQIGALSDLFNRHHQILMPSMLKILDSIPETLPVATYAQLLPGRSSPSTAFREDDWVECEETSNIPKALSDGDGIHIQTQSESTIEMCNENEGFYPSLDEICAWYMRRSRDIDIYSGQLDNSLSLVECACRKGISELGHFHEDILYLYSFVYSDRSSEQGGSVLTIVEWEQLSDYGKFKLILKGVKEEDLLQQLKVKAIPFMRSRFHGDHPHLEDTVKHAHVLMDEDDAQSYILRWLKETSAENKLHICLTVIDEGCKDLQAQRSSIFIDEVEAACCALGCIYSCSSIDMWTTMAAILSKLEVTLAPLSDEKNSIKAMLKRVEAHIEAGRLLAYYQVPKHIYFFVDVDSNEKSVKQILRLMLSKFIRRQPVRSDNDWVKMWRDLQFLHEATFSFLDMDYVLVEFCKGLLKAGRFSLSRNYLNGTGMVAMTPEKAENIVIQCAREYFFSASSLTCSEIRKAKECLSLLPGNVNVRAEADLVDVLTYKLPGLGVTILPVQFRHMSDKMEIIRMAVTSQPGAFLRRDELIEVARTFGLNSEDDVCAIEEAIAREAAVSGNLPIAFDLCLSLARKGHGAVWDLCAALARGPTLEEDTMDAASRKVLLGFSLTHCDDESIGELLNAWKSLDSAAASVEHPTVDPYVHHAESLLNCLEVVGASSLTLQDTQRWFACDVVPTYHSTSKHERSRTLDIIERYLRLLTFPSAASVRDDIFWRDFLATRVMNFVAVLCGDALKIAPSDEEERLVKSLASFSGLVMDGTVSPLQCWATVRTFAGATRVLRGSSSAHRAFCEAMVVSGCRFRAVMDVLSGGGDDPASLYTNVLEDASGGGGLHSICSSLRKQEEGTLGEELKKVRHAVWVADHVRPFLSEIDWEEWDRPRGEGNTTSSKLSRLAALISSSSSSASSSDVIITDDDRLNVDSAVSLLSTLLSRGEIDAVISILEELDRVFFAGEDCGCEVDGWDVHWDDDSDDDLKNKNNLHPLHVCWEEAVRKLCECGRVGKVMDVLRTDRVLLVSEDGALSVARRLIESDRVLDALKVSLSLPYESVHLCCLEASTASPFFHRHDDGGGVADDDDDELLPLVLSSGLMPLIIGGKPSPSCYGVMFCHLCYLVGRWTRKVQEPSAGVLVRAFRDVTLPCFVAELVRSGELMLSAFVVSRVMRTSSCLGVLSVAEDSLRKYLHTHLHKFDLTTARHSSLPPCLASSFSKLASNFECLLQLAISSLPQPVSSS